MHSECTILMLFLKKFPGEAPRTPTCGRGWPPPPPSPFRRFAPQWSLRLHWSLVLPPPRQWRFWIRPCMICLVREYLTRIYEKCFKGLLSLVGYLVHLRHSWQNREKERARQWDRELNVLNTEFPLSGKWYCTQFCKITTGHGNTIEDLVNMMICLLVRNFISIHANTWSVLVSIEIVRWPSGTVLPDFDHILTLSVWIW